MKQYEKMGFDTEAALRWTGECVVRNCDDCPANGFSSGPEGLCCPESYLLSDAPEPPKVPRWKTARTQEEFDSLFKAFKTYCDGRDLDLEECCVRCPYNTGHGGCYHAYLSEMVEVQECEVDNDKA